MSGPNRYRSRAERGEEGWRVVIVDPDGAEVFARPFPGENQARAFASTVDQHVSWLSEATFRRYYRLADPPEEQGS
jgi:hypothetical protein